MSFRMRCDQYASLAIDGLHLIFVELQKLKKSSNFKPESLKDFWTLFLTEYQQLLTMKTDLIPDYPNLIKALNLLDVSGFTPEQLAAYDRYQDNLRNMNSVMISNYKKGLGEGLEKGREEGREEGIEIGQEAGIMLERKRTLSIIKAIQNGQLTMEAIALEHQVSIEFVQQLKGL